MDLQAESAPLEIGIQIQTFDTGPNVWRGCGLVLIGIPRAAPTDVVIAVPYGNLLAAVLGLHFDAAVIVI